MSLDYKYYITTPTGTVLFDTVWPTDGDLKWFRARLKIGAG